MASPNDGLRLPPPWISPAAGKPDREVQSVIIVERRKVVAADDYWFPPTPYSYFESIRAVNYGTPADTLTTPAGTYPSTFIGGVLLPDGRVFCVPFSATTARIYNPATDTLTTPAGTYAGNFTYNGGVLLFDGRVFCVPYAIATARIYGGALALPLPSSRVLSAYDNKF